MTPGGFPSAPSFRHAHGQVRRSKLPTLLGERSEPSGALIHPGMEVIGGGQPIGRVVDLLTGAGIKYLRVIRHGPLGSDEFYLPVSLVQVIGRDFVSVHLRPADLFAGVWHVPPHESSEVDESEDACVVAA